MYWHSLKCKVIVRFGNDLKKGVTEIVAHVRAIFFNNTSPKVEWHGPGFVFRSNVLNNRVIIQNIWVNKVNKIYKLA